MLKGFDSTIQKWGRKHLGEWVVAPWPSALFHALFTFLPAYPVYRWLHRPSGVLVALGMAVWYHVRETRQSSFDWKDVVFPYAVVLGMAVAWLW